MDMPSSHALQPAGFPDRGPAVRAGAVDDLVGTCGVGGGKGGEEVFAGDGEGVALGGADQIVGGFFRAGLCGGRGGGGGGRAGNEGESLFGVGVDDGLEFGEGDVEGAEAGPV